MVRDIMLDMGERDFLTEDKAPLNTPIFDSVWGNLFDEDSSMELLICNILIPEMYWEIMKYTDNELIVYFKSVYKPDTRNFRIRIVGFKEGKYFLFDSIRGDFGIAVNSYALSKNIAAPISACMLPYIDTDGQFAVRLVRHGEIENLDKAYIYSAKNTDLNINFSDGQASQLLTLCSPGYSYRYPTSGVGATRYLNSIVRHTDLNSVLESEFENDGKPLRSAEFDTVTGKLDLLVTPEKEISDTGLTDKGLLDFAFFDKFTDEYVRRNIVLSELTDTDFIKLFNIYENIHSIVLFKDSSTTSLRITNSVVAGQFDGRGNILPSEDYFVVSATLEANTIVMFDDELEDEVKDAPIFFINNSNETRLYTALVEQPYWITEKCHKCFILNKRATLRYMIKQSQFRNGKGLFIIPQTSANIKNMLGLVQDEHTGRLLGVVSNNTNISDITLDEITQYIYATQIND